MSESEIQRRLAVVEEIRRLSYEMRAPHPLALGAVLAEYERRITMEAAAMGAAVSEIVRLRTELEQARDAIGRGWLVGGVSLAEAIRRKTRALELVQAERDPTAADRDTSSHWCPMATAPRDGTEVALLFAREETVTFGVLSTWPRVRAAFFTGSDWSLPYYANNPPIGWAPLPAPPATVPLNTKEETT